MASTSSWSPPTAAEVAAERWKRRPAHVALHVGRHRLRHRRDSWLPWLIKPEQQFSRRIAVPNASRARRTHSKGLSFPGSNHTTQAPIVRQAQSWCVDSGQRATRTMRMARGRGIGRKIGSKTEPISTDGPRARDRKARFHNDTEPPPALPAPRAWTNPNPLANWPQGLDSPARAARVDEHILQQTPAMLEVTPRARGVLVLSAVVSSAVCTLIRAMRRFGFLSVHYGCH